MSLSPAATSLALRLFDRLANETADPPGVTRDTYGKGENAAHALVRAEAEALGLETRVDAVGNLYMTLAGRDRAKPAFYTGSHLDSVPHGGNYDGAAGVVAGLMLAGDFLEAGDRPPTDLVVCAFRGEESWFPTSYIGSNAALGSFPVEDLLVKRDDTGRSLDWHMSDAGFDPMAIRNAEAQIDKARINAFVEVHIEQGPALIAEGIPVGVVTAINGGFRHMEAVATGTWDHSGATPRRHRKDAALAIAEFAMILEGAWDAIEAEGKAATLTLTQLATDPVLHGGSKVAGQVRFALDVRSAYPDVLQRMRSVLTDACKLVKEKRGVAVDMGPPSSWPIAGLDETLIEALQSAAARAGVPAKVMPSGAGHDAAVFAGAGVPTGMLFVRNANGSHNANEAMEIDDLAQAVLVLKDYLLHRQT